GILGRLVGCLRLPGNERAGDERERARRHRPDSGPDANTTHVQAPTAAPAAVPTIAQRILCNEYNHMSVGRETARLRSVLKRPPRLGAAACRERLAGETTETPLRPAIACQRRSSADRYAPFARVREEPRRFGRRAG